MTFPKCSKRLGQFEALEAKKFFAADLVGIASPVEVAAIESADPGDGHLDLTQYVETLSEVAVHPWDRAAAELHQNLNDTGNVANTNLPATILGEGHETLDASLDGSVEVEALSMQTASHPILSGQQGGTTFRPYLEGTPHYENLGGQEGEPVADSTLK